MKARYNRISTPNQNIERQLAKQHVGETLYNDVISGSVAFNKRPKGKELFDDVTAGKVTFISVASIDRLGRNLADIIATIDYFSKHNVILRVDNLGLESMINGKKNPTFDLIASVMGSVAALEKQALLERQAEGIAIAKANGTYKGRERGSVDAPEEVLKKYKSIIKLLNEKISLRKTAKLTDHSLGTVQKVKKLLQAA